MTTELVPPCDSQDCQISSIALTFSPFSLPPVTALPPIACLPYRALSTSGPFLPLCNTLGTASTFYIRHGRPTSTSIFATMCCSLPFIITPSAMYYSPLTALILLEPPFLIVHCSCFLPGPPHPLLRPALQSWTGLMYLHPYACTCPEQCLSESIKSPMNVA